MRPDIVNLRQFYSSRLGRKVKARLRRITRSHWPMHAQGMSVGFGYAIPIESAAARKRGHNELMLALMPREQGGIYWPADSANRTVLGDVMRPPFAPNSLARILMMHLFEYSAAPEELLRISWQLLEPGGRLLLVVPNRRGLWAHFGTTPFATGTPYTLSTLKTLLNETDFTLREVSGALFTPPSIHPLWLHSWLFLEWLGSMLLPRSGGVLVIEAEKQIYAAVGERARVKAAPVWQAQATPSV